MINSFRIFWLQLISIFIFFSLRIVSYIAVGTLTSLGGVCTGYTMLVDSQDPPLIRAKQPRNMDYVKISGVPIRPAVHLTVVARPASCLSLFAVIFTNSILGKFQDNPALLRHLFKIDCRFLRKSHFVSETSNTRFVRTPSFSTNGVVLNLLYIDLTSAQPPKNLKAQDAINLPNI
ncbi:hypothetical protein SeMB42_g05981 [Synchytrium endobioticum]|uniref:Uncharacterized protein n=1 Tax=Synchytrium endobioticum TaxID=286115 RepID=A0A507CMY6_9FUNG|nr:hypothetical protein SeMB42_g05981 [Synchytrium endobioticum]